MTDILFYCPDKCSVFTFGLAALKFCFKTCVAMKFVDDDDDDDDSKLTL